MFCNERPGTILLGVGRTCLVDRVAADAGDLPVGDDLDLGQHVAHRPGSWPPPGHGRRRPGSCWALSQATATSRARISRLWAIAWMTAMRRLLLGTRGQDLAPHCSPSKQALQRGETLYRDRRMRELGPVPARGGSGAGKQGGELPDRRCCGAPGQYKKRSARCSCSRGPVRKSSACIQASDTESKATRKAAKPSWLGAPAKSSAAWASFAVSTATFLKAGATRLRA